MSLHPKLKEFIDRVVVPALADEFMRETKRRKFSLRVVDAVDDDWVEPTAVE